MPPEKKKSSSKHIESDVNIDRDEMALLLQKELIRRSGGILRWMISRTFFTA